MDRLLGYAPNHTKVVKDLEELASSAYLNGGDECAHLAHLMPDSTIARKARLANAVPFTKESLLFAI